MIIKSIVISTSLFEIESKLSFEIHIDVVYLRRHNIFVTGHESRALTRDQQAAFARKNNSIHVSYVVTMTKPL